MKKMKEPNLCKLEINITNVCNLHCHDCDRIINLLPGNPGQNMTVEQIAKFTSQSVENNYEWKALNIMGGEPTLHPRFEEIIAIIADYKRDHNPGLVIDVSSNGFGNFVRKKLDWLQTAYPEITIVNTEKCSIIQKGFDKACVAPADVIPGGERHSYSGCWVPEEVGLGLMYSGFYCCSPAGAIDRIFGYNCGVRNIKDLDAGKLSGMFEDCCSKCGHYCLAVDQNKYDHYVLSPSFEEALRIYEKRDKELIDDYNADVRSSTWIKALEQYESRDRELDLY
jgi:hypothetical protein